MASDSFGPEPSEPLPPIRNGEQYVGHVSKERYHKGTARVHNTLRDQFGDAVAHPPEHVAPVIPINSMNDGGQPSSASPEDNIVDFNAGPELPNQELLRRRIQSIHGNPIDNHRRAA